mmetsp:Transcript_10929/g.33936  ORF Transcript_10929/g.33936 Transcript_10929/m.33936 type:complete len:238 (-) Transcript_10929:996-1709(-)
MLSTSSAPAGSRSASAAKASSRSPSASARTARKALTSGLSAADVSASTEPTAPPVPAARRAYMSSSTRRPTVCSASQRLNESESCAARNTKSSGPAPVSSVTGAEKPRLSDNTGSSSTPSNTIVCSASASRSTPSVLPLNCESGRSAWLSRPTKPTRSGIRKGSFSAAGCLGVSPIDCLSVSVYVLAAASYTPEASTLGVPDCEYQRPNCSKSSPLASAMAARKSSQVAPVPSWRSK